MKCFNCPQEGLAYDLIEFLLSLCASHMKFSTAKSVADWDDYMKWYFATKPIVRKNCSSDREKLLIFEAEGREFSKFLRWSLEQFIQTVKG